MRLPAGLDPSAYRIIQVAADRRVAAVVGASPAAGRGSGDDWRIPGGPPVNAGHGIIGMRERAHLCGGELIARPLREGGFQVTASLPLTATAPDAETMA